MKSRIFPTLRVLGINFMCKSAMTDITGIPFPGMPILQGTDAAFPVLPSTA